MEIRITGSGPNTVISLGAESSAEQLQIAALKRQAKDARADLMVRDGYVIILRLEVLPEPPEPTYCGTERGEIPCHD